MSAEREPEENVPQAQRQNHSPEETARRGDAIYEDTIRARVEPDHRGEVVAIDVNTGAYALGEDAITAARRLRMQQPDAEVWFVRVGSRSLHRIGIQSMLHCA